MRTALHYLIPIAFVAAFFGIASAALEDPEPFDTFHPIADVDHDQCIRREIFLSCLKEIPPSPSTPFFNPWEDVIGHCRAFAAEASTRPKTAITPECAEQVGQ